MSLLVMNKSKISMNLKAYKKYLGNGAEMGERLDESEE